MMRHPRPMASRRGQCSVRTLVMREPGRAVVITQDVRRRRRHVSGYYIINFEPGKERTLARHLGCQTIARIKQ